MLRLPRKAQAIATFLFGVFLAGFVVVNGRLEGLEPWQKDYGVQQYVNHMIDTHGHVRTVLGILGVAALAALATLALPERRR
jgi:hypothetical protein